MGKQAKGRPKAKAASVPIAGEQTLQSMLDSMAAAPEGGGPRDSASEGPRPREGKEVEVRAVVPCWDEALPDPLPIPEKSKEFSDQQSKEVKPNESWPIHKSQRQRFNWVAQSSQNTFTTEPGRMMEITKKFDEDTCDVCGNKCNRKLYTFRCFRKSPELSEEERKRGRFLEPFIAYISEKCALGLLGHRRTAAGIVREWIRCDLLQRPWNQATEELKGLRAFQKKAVMQELAEARDSNKKLCKAAKFQEFKAQGGRDLSLGPLQTLRAADDEEISLNPPAGMDLKDYVLHVLRTITWPDCVSRRNVMKEGQNKIKAFCLGCTKPRFRKELCISRSTQTMPNLTQLIARLAEELPEEFRFTSVQVNKGLSSREAAKFHRDKNNFGDSFIIALGFFANGQLFLASEDPETEADCEITLPEGQKVPAGYKPGQVVRGKKLDIHKKWQRFDGRTGHMAMDFQGERYSLVFFSRKEAYDRMPEEVATKLKGMGFRMPETKWFQETEPTSVLRPTKQMRMDRQEEPDSDSSDDEPEDDTEGAEMEMPQVSQRDGKDALQTSHKAQQLLDFLQQQTELGRNKDPRSSFPPSVPQSVQDALAERGNEIQDAIAQETESLLRSMDDENDIDDWEKRKRKLGTWDIQVPSLSFEVALRWVFQAAMCEEDGRRVLSEQIIQRGLIYMNNCLGLVIYKDDKERAHAHKLDKDLTGLDKFRGQFLQGMERKAHAWEKATRKVYERFKDLSFARGFIAGFEKNEDRWKLGSVTDMEIYVQDVLVPVKGSEVTKAKWYLLKDFATSWPKIQQELKVDFQAWDGPQHLSDLLEEATKDAPSRTKKEVRLLLSTLSSDSLQHSPGILRCCLQLAWKVFGESAEKDVFTKIEVETFRHSSQRVSSATNDAENDEEKRRKKERQTISFLQDLAMLAQQGPERLHVLGQRFEFTVELLRSLDEAKKRLEKTRHLSELQKMLAEIRSMLSKRDDVQLSEASRKSSKCLRDAEDAKWSKVEADVETKLRHAQSEQDAANKAAEALRQQEKKKRQQEKAREAIIKLQALITTGEEPGRPRLKDPEIDLLKSAFGEALKDCVELKNDLEKDWEHQQALEDAKAACKHWQEAPAAKQQCCAVLLKNGLPKCLVAVLEKVGWLERLPKLTAELLAERNFFGFLPPGITESLRTCIQGGKFCAEHLEPRLPEGYQKKTSNTYGVDYYFYRDAGTGEFKTQFNLPLEDLPQEVEICVDEPEGLFRHDDQTAKYIFGRPKHRWCYLCEVYCNPENEHQELRRHVQRKEQWDHLSELLRELIADVEKANMADLCATRPLMIQDILDLWMFDVRSRMKKRAQERIVLNCFWHLVMQPCDVRSPEKLEEFLRERLLVAELPEPDMLDYPTPPRPGEDFPLFPPSGLDLANLPKKLEPLQMLSEGLLLGADGKVHCAFCDMSLDSDPFTIREHLNVKGKSEKKKNHRSYRNVWEEAVKTLQIGWKLEAGGLHLGSGKSGQCQCGSKFELWDLSLGHLGEKKHKDWAKEHRAPSKFVQQKWQQRWEQSFSTMCQEHIARLKSEHLPRWEQHVETGPAAMEGDAAAPGASSTAWEEPELPQPGKDFPDFSTGKMIQGNQCLCCGEKATPGHEQTPAHGRNKQRSLAVFKIIQQKGHQFWRDGIILKDNKVKCQCGKELNSWWELESWFDKNQPHVTTNAHKKWIRNSDQPPAEALPWEEPRRLRWEKSFAVHAPATTEVASRAPPPTTPSPKRRRMDVMEAEPEPETTPEQAPASSQAERGASSSSARSMERAREFKDPPTSEEIKYYTEECVDKRHFPELKMPLCWGWAKFADKKYKTKDGWVYCQQCKVYVAVVSWTPPSTHTLSRAEDTVGACAHKAQLLGVKGLK